MQEKFRQAQRHVQVVQYAVHVSGLNQGKIAVVPGAVCGIGDAGGGCSLLFFALKLGGSDSVFVQFRQRKPDFLE